MRNNQLTRSRFQGVLNIVRFNWPSFAFSTGLVITGLVLAMFFSSSLFALFALLALLPMATSLLVSHWIYDRSGLEKLEALDQLSLPKAPTVVTLTAGFDEYSHLLATRFPNGNLRIFDFYDEEAHSEASVRRARAIYPLRPETKTLCTTKPLPLAPSSIDLVCAFFALHEIRLRSERVTFLQALGETLKPTGRMIISEHLRDLPNAVAFTIGVFHFHSRMTWKRDLAAAGLQLESEICHTPFVRHFILKRS